MDRFVARENIKHLRAQLESEDNPKTRSVLNKLLVEEEDKLASFCRETPGLNGGDPSYLDGLRTKCQ
jgi:hypothetical protein